MSLIAISLTIQQRIDDPLAKFLLLLLADRHNGDTGQCFPSVARLTEDSAMSRSTVLRKLQWLEDNGFIEAQERRRPNGSKASNSYILRFVPAPVGVETEKQPKRRSVRALPESDWRPRDTSIEKIRTRYPHHDTSDETIDYLIREWIGFCVGNDRKYVDFDAAWVNSAERALRRQSARPTPLRPGQGKRGSAGALSGAIRRFGGL